MLSEAVAAARPAQSGRATVLPYRVERNTPELVESYGEVCEKPVAEGRKPAEYANPAIHALHRERDAREREGEHAEQCTDDKGHSRIWHRAAGEEPERLAADYQKQCRQYHCPKRAVARKMRVTEEKPQYEKAHAEEDCRRRQKFGRHGH